MIKYLLSKSGIVVFLIVLISVVWLDNVVLIDTIFYVFYVSYDLIAVTSVYNEAIFNSSSPYLDYNILIAY